jgi:hypothetical protein
MIYRFFAANLAAFNNLILTPASIFYVIHKDEAEKLGGSIQ